MRFISAVLVFAALAFFAPSAFAAVKPTARVQKPVAATVETKQVDTPEASEKKRAIEDVNTLIIDSYRNRLDKTLVELYDNIRIATKGDESAQI